MKLLLLLALVIISTFSQETDPQADFIGVYTVNGECQNDVCPLNNAKNAKMDFGCPKDGYDKLWISQGETQWQRENPTFKWQGYQTFDFSLQAEKNHWWQYGKQYLKQNVKLTDFFTDDDNNDQVYFRVHFDDSYSLNVMKCPDTESDKFPECKAAQQDNPDEEIYVSWKTRSFGSGPVEGCTFTLVKDSKMRENVVYIEEPMVQHKKLRSHKMTHKHKLNKKDQK